jgi:hypothetical protein
MPAGARDDPGFAGAYRSRIVRRSCAAGAAAHSPPLIPSRVPSTRSMGSSPARGCPAGAPYRTNELDTPGPDCWASPESSAGGTDQLAQTPTVSGSGRSLPTVPEPERPPPEAEAHWTSAHRPGPAGQPRSGAYK